ncbi:MAG: peptide deformylase [Patescibacteria group bacterium]
MVPIITAPHPVLSKPVKKITKVNKGIRDLLKEMEEALLSAKDPEGVGLAAPQIGKSLAIFITKPTHKSPIHIFINPQIISEEEIPEAQKKKSHSARLEGCLSLPTIWGEVKRNPSLVLSYMDQKGRRHDKPFKGFMATIIQHEADHLNGKLFTERVLDQGGTLYKSHKNEKNEDEFEELEI